MLRRVQNGIEPALRVQVAQFRNVTPALSFLLNQSALAAFVFALWRLGVDLGITGQFLISSGLFSHWQVWMVCAVALRLMASSLNRTVNTSNNQ